MLEKGQGPGISVLPLLEQIGYDYVELSLSDIMKLDDEQFVNLRQRVMTASIPCLACHNFFPPVLRLTGTAADHNEALRYADQALQRAKQLGVSTVVFGSPGARNIPQGFPKRQAYNQIVTFCRELSGVAHKHDITVVIEPVNKSESNFINTVAEGYALMLEVHRDSFMLLADYYHMKMEQEDFSVLDTVGSSLRHIHMAEQTGRAVPVQTKKEYERFFQALHRINYNGNISIEGNSNNKERDLPLCLKVISNGFDGQTGKERSHSLVNRN